ncbi:MAG: polysaccharide biosynthesis tyrosine autokinase [Candidatus Tectomicrobia bacterium]|nr:polysaccharide biosynthesis tyrosine autokinase [Candidatus Tectomicrobia bacterium]
MGALPEQLDANINKLDRLQAELQTVNEALLKAEEKKILYERELREAMTLPVDIKGAPAKPAPDPREAKLRQLKQDLARLRAQFTESYPDIPVAKGRIRELEADLTARPPNIPVVVTATPTISPQAEIVQAQLEGQLGLVKREITALQRQQRRIQETSKRYDKRIELTFENEQKLADLTRDFQITHQNYQDLLQKRLDAKLSENLEKRQQGERFQILDPAYLPMTPYKPKRQEMVFFGAVAGGGFGVAMAFLLEYLGSSGFRRPEELQDAFTLPLLGAIPSNEVSRRDHQLVAMEEPESLTAEQFRILYTKMDNARRDKSHKIFAISSAIADEGKTVSTLNLAIVIARDFGKKIMLLEGDFKRPSLPLYLKTTTQGGLVDVLMDEPDGPATLVPMADTMLPFAHENLSILPAVKSIRNSSNLLSSRRMKGLLDILKLQYDFILIDAPPVLPLSDMNLFREVVDGIILIVRAETTPRRAVQQTMEMLGTEKIIGLVLNDVKQKFQPYYQYYGDYSTDAS